MKSYKIRYSQEALNDLREIYVYIAEELEAPENAAGQVERIRKEIRSLDMFPGRYTLVEWEPWFSMKMHQFPVNNYIVFYLVEEDTGEVTIVRIIYCGRDIEELIRLK